MAEPGPPQRELGALRQQRPRLPRRLRCVPLLAQSRQSPELQLTGADEWAWFCRAVFDLSKDPGEHNDLSASLPQVKQQLLEALAAANRTAFQTNDTPGYTKCEARAVVEARNRGFVGMVCAAGEPEV